MRALFVRYIREAEAQDLIEYALLGGIIVAVGAVAIGLIAGQVDTLFSNLCTALTIAC